MGHEIPTYNIIKNGSDDGLNLGSIGSIASAATVAASSFTMKITSPNALLQQLDFRRFKDVLSCKSNVKENITDEANKGLVYVEPAAVEDRLEDHSSQSSLGETITEKTAIKVKTLVRRGKIQRLGDFIDTDAVSLLRISERRRTYL